MCKYVHTAVLLVATTLLACVGLPAHAASGGPVLISQPKQFPITITEPGSYQLEENLVVPDVNTTAIEVAANDVTIDLNGFSISGPVVCSGTSCPPSGFGNGISTAGILPVGCCSNITVRNGTIRGMGGRGISLSHNSVLIEDMHIRSNAGAFAAGVDIVGLNATIRHSSVDSHCGGTAIFVQVEGFLISDNVVTGCGNGFGVVSGVGSTGSVLRNVIVGHGVGLALYNSNTGYAGYSGNVFENNVLNVLPGYGINLGQNLCGNAVCPGGQL